MYSTTDYIGMEIIEALKWEQNETKKNLFTALDLGRVRIIQTDLYLTVLHGPTFLILCIPVFLTV